MSADTQFRAFIDRILRCREAEDAAKEDTKAVYAELKAEGYDKSIVGKLIAELRSREKNSAKVDEQETLLELYRDAYQRASGTGIAIAHPYAGATPIPSQDGKTESEGLASAPVTEHEQARVPSHASQADPVATSLGAGSADQFNDTGPHVFSDSEVPA